MKPKNTTSRSFPAVIGTVIAAVCITQKNWTGALFAVVVGIAVSLVAYVKSRHDQEK